MSLLKVTSEQLLDLSSYLNTGSQQVQSELDDMRRRLEPLASDWEGAASGNFQALWAEWQTSARNLREALEGISTLLRNAGQTYQEAEDAVRQSMSH